MLFSASSTGPAGRLGLPAGFVALVAVVVLVLSRATRRRRLRRQRHPPRTAGLLEAPAALVRVPAYLLLLLLVRGVPTLVLVHWLERRPALAVLVAAGPLSVLLFPPLAPAVLGPPVAGPASDR